MSKAKSHVLSLVAVFLASASIAWSAAADWGDICQELLEDHPNDAEWRDACLAAMAEFEEERGPVTPGPPPPPKKVFPYAKTQGNTGGNGLDLDAIVAAVVSGQSADVLIEFDVSALRSDIHTRALNEGLQALDGPKLAEKRAGYSSAKSNGLDDIDDLTILEDYENLPMVYARIVSMAGLDALLNHPEILAIYSNRPYQHFLTESLALIEHSAVVTAGFQGAGTTIAVLDTGVDYTVSPFNCTSPGTPAGCRVAQTFEAAPDDSSLDDNGHGTNVSGIAASVAGDADLVVADVFDGSVAMLADIQQAISWAIGNQGSLNIVAMNLSLGDTSVNTSHCSSSPFATPLADALAAGIQPVVASGNTAFFNGSFDDGVADPACVPAAVSVGAVYDANVGGLTWNSAPFQCTDTTTAADKVTCFSQTAPILSLLAPGAIVTAAGITAGGTSQAAPHVAGGWAIVRAAGGTNSNSLGVLQDVGDPVTDPRPSGGRTTPRLDLLPEPGSSTAMLIGALGVGLLARRRR